MTAWSPSSAGSPSAALADEESQRSAWTVAGKAFLYMLRFIVAPPSTARGTRQALLNATPLPGLPAAERKAVGPPRDRKPRRKSASRKRSGPTKTDQLVSLAAERHDLSAIPLTEVSALASGIAGEIDLHPGTARRVLLGHVRALQDGGKS